MRITFINIIITYTLKNYLVKVNINNIFILYISIKTI